MGPLATDQVVFLALGAAALAAGAGAWTGRWRRWARDLLSGAVPITIVPALGALFVVYGLSPVLPGLLGAALGVGALGVALAAFAVAALDPPWFGPRWYRERDRTPDLSLAGTAWFAGLVGPAPGTGSEATARAARPRPPLARRRAHLVDPTWCRPSPVQTRGRLAGFLLIWPDELVFAADRADDAVRGGPTVLVRPVGGTALRPEGRGVRLAGPGAPDWPLVTARPRRLVADLARVGVTHDHAHDPPEMEVDR